MEWESLLLSINSGFLARAATKGSRVVDSGNNKKNGPQMVVASTMED